MYHVAVRIERAERKKRSTGVLHVLAGFFLIANTSQYIKELNYNGFWPLIPIFILALLSLVYGFFRKKVDPNTRYNHWLRGLQAGAFLTLGILLLQVPSGTRSVSLFLWALISLLLFLSERKLFEGAVLKFSQTSICLPGTLWDKTVTWNEVEQVSVRPDFITFHFTGNRYLQYEMLHPLEITTLKGLQDFCHHQLREVNA